MKKIAILVASVLVLGGFTSRTLAAEINTQTTQTTETSVSFKEDAGITPDSLLYTIDQAVDQLRVILAGSEEKEAQVITDIAQERLGESEVMAEEGKTELAEQALEEYNDKITEAADTLKEVVSTTEVAAEENSDEKLQQSIEDLVKAIQEVQDKSLIVLDNLQDMVSEEASETLDKVIEEQTAKREVVANFVKERHEFNAVKKSLNMAKVELKKVEKTGNEEEIKKAQEDLANQQQAYMTAKTELQSAFSSKQAAVKAETKKATETTAPVEQDNKAVEAAAGAATETKTADYTKTNNGNGNGGKETQAKVEKEDKASTEKSGQVDNKSSQANIKKN